MKVFLPMWQPDAVARDFRIVALSHPDYGVWEETAEMRQVIVGS